MTWMREHPRESFNECRVEAWTFETSSALRNNWIARNEWLWGAPAREKHLKYRKEYDQHRKLELDPPEKERMENDELEASLGSSWESPDKNIDVKWWRDFTRIKGYLIKTSESLRKKGGRAGKTKTIWRRMKMTPLRRTDNWSCGRWKWMEPLEEKTHRLKRIDMTISIIMKD